jgi:hypothetical protein
MTAIDWAGLAEAVRGFGATATETADGLSLIAEGGHAGTIRALPPPPGDELVPVAVLRAETFVAAGKLAGLPPPARMVHGLNRLAGAAAARAQDGGLAFHARVTLFAGDEKFWPLHAQLLAYAATWGPATALGGMHRVLGKRPPHASGASAWTPEDFEQARAALPKHRRAMLDKPSPHVLAATVPLPGKRNPARVEVRADMQHPEHGPGLMALLTLPVRFPTESALGEALDGLNRVEAGPIAAAPHYGAWCAGPDGTVAYTCFLPNGVKLPVAHLLLAWLSTRAPLAADALTGPVALS